MSEQVRTWLNSQTKDRREQVAKAACTSVAYLWQLAGAHSRASIELAGRLQEASGGELTIAGIRPDLYALISQSAA